MSRSPFFFRTPIPSFMAALGLSCCMACGHVTEWPQIDDLSQSVELAGQKFPDADEVVLLDESHITTRVARQASQWERHVAVLIRKPAIGRSLIGFKIEDDDRLDSMSMRIIGSNGATVDISEVRLQALGNQYEVLQPEGLEANDVVEFRYQLTRQESLSKRRDIVPSRSAPTLRFSVEWVFPKAYEVSFHAIELGAEVVTT